MNDPLDLRNYSARVRAFGVEDPPQQPIKLVEVDPVPLWEFGVLSAALFVLGGGIGAVIARLVWR